MKKAPQVRLLVFGIVIVGSGFAIAYQVGGSLKAQSLVAPSFTAAQQTAGQAAYAQNCASCHGANMDDGSAPPPRRGIRRHGSASYDALFTKIETMLPAAPDRRARRSARRAVGMSCRRTSLQPATSRCRPIHQPGDAASWLRRRPSGGLSGGERSASPVRQPARHTHQTEAMLQNPFG